MCVCVCVYVCVCVFCAGIILGIIGSKTKLRTGYMVLSSNLSNFYITEIKAVI